MKTFIENRLSKMLGFTLQELRDILSIIGEHLVIETGVDVLGALDPTLIAAMGVEIPEIGIDIAMCVRIWQYFKQENINESNKISFIEMMQSHSLESAASGVLAYGLTSVLKFAVGKVAGKAAAYVGSTVISGGINAVQTIATGLIWAKYSKEKVGSLSNPESSKLQEPIVDNGRYEPAAI